MAHIVKKQIIEILIDSAIDPFVVQQRISTLFHDHILPLLAQLFDKFSDDPNVLSIDQLVIDLGPFTESELNGRDGVERLLAILEIQLTEQLRSVALEKSAREEVKVTRLLHIFQQWLFYMRNGYLPWNATTPDEDWLTKVLESVSTDNESVDAIRALIRDDHRAVTRLVLQHSVLFLTSLLEALTARNQGGITKMIEKIAALMKDVQRKGISHVDTSPRTLQHQLWESTFIMVTSKSSNEWSTQVITYSLFVSVFTTGQLLRLRSVLQSRRWKGVPVLIKDIIKELGSGLSDANAIAGQEGNDESAGADVQSREANDKLVGVKMDKHDLAEVQTTNERILVFPDETSTQVESDATSEFDEEGIFVSHAGLILLHPFLNYFFKERELVRDGTFVSSLSWQRAILLLQFLSNGKVNPPEHELVISKLLCGYPLNEPVDSGITLSQEDISSAEELLQDVIKQWSILKGTSVEGLRESFLQRMGKLYGRDGRPCLHVENKSIDLLIDHLPWALSPIKLPWMKKILHVEWR